MKKILLPFLMLFSIHLKAQENAILTNILMSRPLYNLGPNDTLSMVCSIDTSLINRKSWGFEFQIGPVGDFSQASLFAGFPLKINENHWRITFFNNGYNFGPLFGKPGSVNIQYKFQVTIVINSVSGHAEYLQNVKSSLFTVNQIASSVGIANYSLSSEIKEIKYYNILGQLIGAPFGLYIKETLFDDGIIHREKFYKP